MGLTIIAVLVSSFFLPDWLERETSIESRMALARYAVQILALRPVLGVGPAQYRSYAAVYHPVEWRTVQSGLLGPHNYWLSSLVNTGLVGMAALVWLLWKVIRYSVSLYHRFPDGFSRALALSVPASTVGFFISAAGGHMGFLPPGDPSWFGWILPWWILLGLLVARAGLSAEHEQDGA